MKMILSELTSPLGAMPLATDEHGHVRALEFAERRSRLHRNLREQSHRSITSPPWVLKSVGTPDRRLDQISACSEISSASSTSIPRYLTVDSSLAWLHT